MSGARRKTAGRWAGVSVIALTLAIAGCQGGGPRQPNLPVAAANPTARLQFLERRAGRMIHDGSRIAI